MNTDTDILPSEAILAFTAWLSTRQERVILSAHDDASRIAELVAEFCRYNGMEPPGSPTALRFPPDCDCPITPTPRPDEALFERVKRLTMELDGAPIDAVNESLFTHGVILKEILRRLDELAEALEQPDQPEPLMTVQDVADYLGLSKRTIEKMIDEGEITPIWIRRKRRFDRRAIDAYVRSQAR